VSFVNLQSAAFHPAIIIDTLDILYARTFNQSSTSGVSYMLLVKLRSQETAIEIRYVTEQERNDMYTRLTRALA
jgi:hypothetical protein